MLLTIEVKGTSLARLENLSKQTGQTVTDYAAKAIEKHLEYLSDLEDIRIAQKNLEEIQNGQDTTISLEEAIKKYGI